MTKRTPTSKKFSNPYPIRLYIGTFQDMKDESYTTRRNFSDILRETIEVGHTIRRQVPSTNKSVQAEWENLPDETKDSLIKLTGVPVAGDYFQFLAELSRQHSKLDSVNETIAKCYTARRRIEYLRQSVIHDSSKIGSYINNMGRPGSPRHKQQVVYIEKLKASIAEKTALLARYEEELAGFERDLGKEGKRTPQKKKVL